MLYKTVHPEATFEEEMMSQRFTLFYAGFTAYAPALYFNQQQFFEACKTEGNEVLNSYILQLSDGLQERSSECNTHLKTAISVAEQLDIRILPQPNGHEDYYNWVMHYTDCFEQQFPMARIDHYYFLFARKVSEILGNLDLLKTYADIVLSTDMSIDLSRKVEKSLKDIEYILFKLMAAAALLSSEPRQNYFNVYYRSLCQEFQPLKGIQANNMQKKDFQKLKTLVEEYNILVMDGFKKCIGLLKELGI